MSLKIAVLGMGAVGSLYASQLQAAGNDIIACCRSDYDLVQQKGITIKHPNGSITQFKPNKVVKALSDLSESVDIVIVATKVLPSIDTVSALKGLNFKAILLLQNGIFIETDIKQAFPGKELLSGLAFVCVSRLKPGYVHHQDYGALCIGKYPKGSSDAALLLSKQFESIGTKCIVSEDVLSARFKKLCWNAPFNPLSVTEGELSTESLLAIKGMEQTIYRIMKEVQHIANHCGHGFSDEVIHKHIADTKKMVAYKTSMLLDWQHNRDIEIDAILGHAIAYAKNEQLQCPELIALYDKLAMRIDKRSKA